MKLTLRRSMLAATLAIGNAQAFQDRVFTNSSDRIAEAEIRAEANKMLADEATKWKAACGLDRATIALNTMVSTIAKGKSAAELTATCKVVATELADQCKKLPAFAAKLQKSPLRHLECTPTYDEKLMEFISVKANGSDLETKYGPKPKDVPAIVKGWILNKF
jgi:non-homologous end joining protein Ku